MSVAAISNPVSGSLIAEAVKWRRHIHQHPELAYQEHQTADFVAARLEEWGLKVHRGLAETGVIGTLERGTSGRTIGIRADMDALPITEKSGVEHVSQHAGIMHACGHDGHVAILLAAARACTQLSELDGTVHFIFQPAEEGEGGAHRMVEEGLFKRFPCESIYGLHNWPALPLGTCAVRDGAILGAVAVFEILLTGRGCHGAFPHEGTDVILAGSQLVAALQSIVSRNVQPRQGAVVSVTQFQAGDTWNTLPDRCAIRGTTRWFDDGVGETLEQRMQEIAQSVSGAFGCQATINYQRRTPATINDAQVTAFVREVVSRSGLGLTLADIEPSTGAEDFAFMLQQVPGCYVLLGAGRGGENPMLHSPQFDFNDDALPIGAALWVSLVRQKLCVPVT